MPRFFPWEVLNIKEYYQSPACHHRTCGEGEKGAFDLLDAERGLFLKGYCTISACHELLSFTKILDNDYSIL